MTESQTDHEELMSPEMAVVDRRDEEYTFDIEALESQGDLLGIASLESYDAALVTDEVNKQYRLIPPAIWAQVDLQLAMGQAVTAEQIQYTIAHVTGCMVPQSLIKHHVRTNRDTLLNLRGLYLKESYECMKSELMYVAGSPSAMKFQRIATMLGALGEGMLKKALDGKMAIDPVKYKVLVQAFKQLQESDPMASRKDRRDRQNENLEKDREKIEEQVADVVGKFMTGGKGAIPGVAKEHCDKTLQEYMVISDDIAAGPQMPETQNEKKDDPQDDAPGDG